MSNTDKIHLVADSWVHTGPTGIPARCGELVLRYNVCFVGSYFKTRRNYPNAIPQQSFCPDCISLITPMERLAHTDL